MREEKKEKSGWEEEKKYIFLVVAGTTIYSGSANGVDCRILSILLLARLPLSPFVLLFPCWKN